MSLPSSSILYRWGVQGFKVWSRPESKLNETVQHMQFKKPWEPHKNIRGLFTWSSPQRQLVKRRREAVLCVDTKLRARDMCTRGLMILRLLQIAVVRPPLGPAVKANACVTLLFHRDIPIGCSFPRLPLLPKLELDRLLALLSVLRSAFWPRLPAKLLALVTAGIEGRSEPLESTLLQGRSFCQWHEEESSEVPLFCLLDAWRMLFGRLEGGSTVSRFRLRSEQNTILHYITNQVAALLSNKVDTVVPLKLETCIILLLIQG